MSNSGSSTPESDDTFISVQENFDLNPVLDINSQDSTKSPQKEQMQTAAEENLDLDEAEVQRIFAEPFEEVTVSTETNKKLQQLTEEKEKEREKENEKEKQHLPGDARNFCEGTWFKAVSLNEIEEAKMATIAEKTMH